MAHLLHKYRILVADADQNLSKVLKAMLAEMGFTNVRMTRSGQEALEILKHDPHDFLVTEWDIQHMDGASLIRRIRRDPDSPNPALPVVMLTGRAELQDVLAARDSGTNEYVIKPFSARTVYSRLERLVEKPRSFVLSKQFVGPDRRIRKLDTGEGPNRRTQILTPIAGKITAGDLLAADTPRIWLPDHALKSKIGNLTLQSLITPAVLEASQAAIDAIAEDSLNWIKDNLAEIKNHWLAMINKTHAPKVAEEIGGCALLINSRAGTFGYTQAAQVAYMLYLFCRNHLNPEKTAHHTVVIKHIEVLQIMLGNDIRGVKISEENQIISELENLTKKYAA